MQLHNTSGRWQLGLTLSLLAVFLWGILPIALTIMLEVLDVYTLTWFRFAIAFALLAIYLTARQQLPNPQTLYSTSLKLLAIATLFLGLNYLFYLQGLAQTSPTNAQVFIQLAPVLFGVGALAVFKERYTYKQWLGLGILTLGFALFFHEKLKTVLTSQSTYLLGNCIIILGAIAWAIYALAQKQLLQKFPSSSIMLIIYGGCMLLFTPFSAPQILFTLSPYHLSILLFCGLNTLIAYGALAEALDHWEASRVSAVLALTPIVTVISIWAVSWLTPTLIPPDHLTLLGGFGAILVMIGSMAVALGKKQLTPN
ncbi:MAG TPA: EamA family transporter [Cyanobacteria bacterium UBA11162]|nr:EamA family transporter [Cyanobacteria bacterium UBA11162]